MEACDWKDTIHFVQGSSRVACLLGGPRPRRVQLRGATPGGVAVGWSAEACGGEPGRGGGRGGSMRLLGGLMDQTYMLAQVSSVQGSIGKVQKRSDARLWQNWHSSSTSASRLHGPCAKAIATSWMAGTHQDVPRTPSQLIASGCAGWNPASMRLQGWPTGTSTHSRRSMPVRLSPKHIEARGSRKVG